MLSKKIKIENQIEFEKDKRGLKDLPDTLRRQARMSKRQLRWSLLIAGLALVLLVAVMTIADRKATDPLVAFEGAEVMKDVRGAEYIDIINKSTSIALRPSETGEPVMLNGRRLILLRRSGVTADDYWFTACTKSDAKNLKKLLENTGATTDVILLETEDNTSLYVFKARKTQIEKCQEEFTTRYGKNLVFINYNSLPADYFSGEAAVDEGMSDQEVLLHRLMGRLVFIQYTLNAGAGEISFFRATDVDLQKVESTVSMLKLVRIAFILLLIAALGVLAYTLKAKKILTKDRAQQHVIRLAVLGAVALVTVCLVFITTRINNQNDQMIRIGYLDFPYEVDDTDTKFESKAGVDEELLIKYAEYLPQIDEDAEDKSKAPLETEDGIIVFRYYTSDSDNIDVPMVGEQWDNELGKFVEKEYMTKLRDAKGNPIFMDVIAYMHTSTRDASRPTDTFVWRTIYYVTMALIVALFAALLYFYRYERDLGFPIINTAILILLMIVTLYPVLNTVAYSFSSGNAASRGKIGIIPQEFTTKSYADILDNYMYGAAGISVAKTIVTTVLNLFWTGMLAFTLTRKEYVLGRFITLVMVLTMYVNAGLIPNFLLISQTLGLKGSFWVYIIPTMFSCFNMIIIRTYIAALPGELVESARIDGAGDFRIYWQIIFPLCAPVLATVALFIAVGSWNSWFDTMLYNDSIKSLHTLQYVLKGKVATAGMTASLAQTSTAAATDLAKTTVNSRTVQCATTVVTALPILVIYPFLQRYFVTGMALGSVKG